MPIIEHCSGCPYRDGPAIGTRGEPGSPIVLVGEAPGANEVIEGRPFVGPAGDVLWGAVEEAELREADLFVANSVACRPFNPDRHSKREPTREAIDACHERLVGDIAPNTGAVIVALGRTAIYAVTGVRDFPVTKSPDTIFSSPWGPVVPTVHPAWVLRFKSKRARLVDDLVFARLLAEGLLGWSDGDIPIRPSGVDTTHPLSPLNRRLRMEFLAGAEEDSRRRLGRPLTVEELERVLRDYPGDFGSRHGSRPLGG